MDFTDHQKLEFYLFVDFKSYPLISTIFVRIAGVVSAFLNKEIAKIVINKGES